ncbi:hypothetical protein BAU17_11035 [Enterococcus sp. CU12B]|uniref:Uncharacterized protein n=2 Tax=Candidatus Enterococcus willemsii TaxID=1857215 RepID=A0ABQ6Z3B4_9ENTE|nr:hypothetical protein BAU17_11035 [Enterococcus sp. CU12B]
MLIGYLTPLTSDDWVWGSSVGLERLNNFFNNYNGRYLGNLTILLITQFLPIKSVVMAIVNTLIIIFSVKIIWGKLSVKRIGVTFILLSVMPLTIFSQTYGWASGFSNYNMSALVILMNIYLFREIIYPKCKKTNNSYAKIVLSFIIGVGGQLFAEHVTIFNVLFSLGILIVTVITKRSRKQALAFFTGNIIGSLIMFSNEAYRSILTGEDTYRTIDQSSGLIEKIYTIFTTYMFKQLIFNNTIINLVISILLISLLIFIGKKYIKTKLIFILYLTVFPLYKLLVYDLMDYTHDSVLIDNVNALLSLIYILVIGFSVLIFLEFEKLQSIFYLCSYALVASPLFFVTPLSPRCFIASYVLLSLFVLSLIKNLLNVTRFEMKEEYNYILLGVTFLLMGTYIVVFAHIHIASEHRLSYIQEKVNQDRKEVNFRKLPNSQFIYESTPNPNGYMEKNFRRYYEIPEDVILKHED